MSLDVVRWTYAGQPSEAWRPDPTTGLDRWGCAPHRPHNGPDVCALCSCPLAHVYTYGATAYLRTDHDDGRNPIDTHHRGIGWLEVCPGCAPEAVRLLGLALDTLAERDPDTVSTFVRVRHPWQCDGPRCCALATQGTPGDCPAYTDHHVIDRTAADRLF